MDQPQEPSYSHLKHKPRATGRALTYASRNLYTCACLQKKAAAGLYVQYIGAGLVLALPHATPMDSTRVHPGKKLRVMWGQL